MMKAVLLCVSIEDVNKSASNKAFLSVKIINSTLSNKKTAIPTKINEKST